MRALAQQAKAARHPGRADRGGVTLERVDTLVPETIDAGGTGWVVTDNDGVEGGSGETQLLKLGARIN